MQDDVPAHQIKLKIVTPEKEILKDFYDQVTLPTMNGEITVMARHTPLVAILKPGELRLKKGGHITALAVSSGFIEVRPNSKIVILADTAERAEHIDLDRAEAARQRAKKMLDEKMHEEHVDYAKLQALLEKEMARIKVARKYKKISSLNQ